MQEKYDELLGIIARVDDLNRAAGILHWDQQTYMPAGGAAARAAQMATLESAAHEIFTAPRVGELLAELRTWAESQGYDSTPASLVRVVRREYDRERRLPSALVAEKAAAVGLALDAWQRAKRAADFAVFQPHLSRLVELAVAEAEALGYEDERYDALVGRYEPGMRTAVLSALFLRLERELVPLVKAVAEREPPADPLVDRTFPAERQLAFGRELLTAMGFDFQRGRLDLTEHPFTTSFSTGDVRVTTHVHTDKPLANIFGVIHEGGHALYEQGFSADHARTPLANAASLGWHESQSRLWENVIGRSRPFWEHFFPRLRDLFPAQLAGVALDGFHQAVNRVLPGPIRIEADELTYNLHIILRFNLERDLLNGTITVPDLPGIWRERMRESLGVRPDNDAQGILQDIHWASGMFGYFPAYALGNVIAAQVYERILGDIPDLPQRIAHGELDGLKQWLNGRIHAHGAKYEPDELIERVTGAGLTVEPYLEYLRKKYGELYRL